MAAAAAGKVALGAPRPNPSGDGPRRLSSPPGKGKPVALADITNTGRPNATRSLSVGEVVKENAKLVQLLNEKTRIIEVSRVEMQKLHLALQVSRQQNVQLAQANSQMLMELNLGKDKVKELQHALSCTAALLKVRDSELEKTNKVANQWREEVNSQDVMTAIPSKASAVAVPSNTACQESPNNITTRRGRNKRKSESSECIKDPNVMQDHYKPHLQPALSLGHEDLRKPVRRRSTRLNPGSCEVTEVSCSKLSGDDVIPSVPSSSTVQKQYESTSRKDMQKSLQNECSDSEAVIASGFKKMKINGQSRKETNLKEVQESYSSVPGIETHQVCDKASTIKQTDSAETSSLLPFNIVEPPKALEDTGNERVVNKQKLKSGKDSATENTNANCDSNTSKPLRHNEKRKSQRGKSARLDSILHENIMNTSETLHEDVIAPLLSSNSNASMEQTTKQKHTDGCSSTKANEGQVSGRKSLRRAAEKVVSYKEIPLNVKMRRP